MATDDDSADFKTKIASLAGDTNAVLCGATWKIFSGKTSGGIAQTDCAGSDVTEVTDAAANAESYGLGPSGGTAWIRDQCYKFGAAST